QKLQDGFDDLIDKYEIQANTSRLFGALTIFFTREKVTNYQAEENTDGELFAKFFRGLINRGINIAPSKYEAWHLTTAHTYEDIEDTLQIVEDEFKYDF